MEAIMPETSFYHISQAGKLSRVKTVDAALAASKGGGFVWLNYSQPAKEELSRLIESLNLHPLSIEDCFDENQIPKIEDFPRNTFILFNAFSYSEEKLSIGEIDLFIGENFLITVGQRDSENRELLNGIERIVEMDIESARQGPAFLMHIILDHIVDQKFLAIEALEDELDTAEDAMLADAPNFQPCRTGPIAPIPVESPQESFPRTGDPRQDLPQRLSLHFRKGNLPLSGHLRPSREIL
jgi:magnesium transporter